MYEVMLELYGGMFEKLDGRNRINKVEGTSMSDYVAFVVRKEPYSSQR
jgi:hypothetical protein